MNCNLKIVDERASNISKNLVKFTCYILGYSKLLNCLPSEKKICLQQVGIFTWYNLKTGPIFFNFWYWAAAILPALDFLRDLYRVLAISLACQPPPPP